MADGTPIARRRRRERLIVLLLLLIAAAVWGVWLLVSGAPSRATATPQPRSIASSGDTLTFLAWSDQHVGRDGNAAHLLPAVRAMNTIAGVAYPAVIGGKVAMPAFVIGCGDCTDWPTRAAVNVFADITRRLNYPSYNVVGNHDEGDDVASSRLARWVAARHGDTSYVFDAGGIRFIVLFSRYNAKQAITPEALTFLRGQLQADPKRPAIVATHYCLDAISNKDKFADALEAGNVILVLGGHYHHAVAGSYRGRAYFELASPTASPEFSVVRIDPRRIVVLTWDYGAGQWVDLPRTRLDVARRSPAGTAAPD
ncbi:MAG: metallophosphoesterase family protein [Tepidisphaerales bacterium]